MKPMTKNKAEPVVKKFNKLDLHDDGLKAIRIHPLNKRTNSVNVDLEFQDDSTGGVKLLSFRRCGNLRYIMDFDVLAANWFAQTEKGAATSDGERLRKFIQAQKSHWHVTYMPPSPKDKPIRKKLFSLRSYALFKVTFFGGTIEVLAKSFTFRRAGNGAQDSI